MPDPHLWLKLPGTASVMLSANGVNNYQNQLHRFHYQTRLP